MAAYPLLSRRRSSLGDESLVGSSLSLLQCNQLIFSFSVSTVGPSGRHFTQGPQGHLSVPRAHRKGSLFILYQWSCTVPPDKNTVTCRDMSSHASNDYGSNATVFTAKTEFDASSSDSETLIRTTFVYEGVIRKASGAGSAIT